MNEYIWASACFKYNEEINLSQNGESSIENNSASSFNPEIIVPDSIINEPPDSTDLELINPDSTDLEGFTPDTTLINADSLKLNEKGEIDTTFTLKDTTIVDSTALDSTNRLKYFRYHREDRPYLTLKKSRGSSFFAEPGTRTRTLKIDSTGKNVVIEEKVAGQETKILLTMPLDEYINMSMAIKQREIWEQEGYKYELKDEKRGLGELISDITDFEIPLPKVGVLSIFGEPKISLKIGGAVDIHGAWRSETTEGVTASRLGNTRNEPDFKQQVQINVNGTIGDKLNISADWNTERTFEYENQLKIKYTGYEDEIIQSIEAGNVSLQTSPLVGGSEALFGIKANFKMGPLSLTTIASQKKGEIKEVSVTGGAQSQEFNVRAYDYSTNHYFLDTIYADTTAGFNFFNRYYGQATPDWNPNYYVVDIEVWKSISTVGKDPSRERQANAYIDLFEIGAGERYLDSLRFDITPVPGRSETGRFILLTPEVDYTVHRETGFISFNTQINDEDVIAVSYRRENNPGPSDDAYYGEFINNSTDSVLVLKLIKPRSLQATGTYTTAWKLQLKNIYPVGGRNLKQEGFEFYVKYELQGQDPVTELNGVRLLQAFGLDVTDASATGGPDNVFDFRSGLTIIPQTGEIIFPNLQPFGNNLPESLPDSIAYPEVYDRLETFARQVTIKDKWLLTGKYSGEASSVYQLGFNVVENSVRVLLNGRELTPGVDYTVDYNIGQLTIRNDAALVPGADLKVSYEQNDLFQLASKTLLGARGLIQFSPKTSLGFSILNLNQQTLSDKVRIGEEPLSNTIYGTDFSTIQELPFMTKLLDNVISTREMSQLTLSGEYAYMNPDPNTKKSTIQSDEGKSIAYIDDFEGAKRIIPVGISYTSWRDLSPPDNLPNLPGTTAAERMSYKAKSFWFTATPSNVNVKDIWPEKDVAKADQQVTVMDYVYLPNDRGTFNYTPTLTDLSKNWGGIYKNLSSTASNLVEENIEFLELWVKIQKAPAGSSFYIDLGRISEDVIPNNKLDTEDKDFNDAIDPDGKEDTGLDGIPNADERTLRPELGGDPSGDDFAFTSSSNPVLSDYIRINGTEGNAILSDIGRLPDTEDLNRNGAIDLVNSYYRYQVPLDTDRTVNPYIAGGGDNAGWYLFRIPLRDTTIKVGDPSFTNVEYIRMFVSGVTDSLWIRMTEFNLVGNQWEKAVRTDTIMAISVINQEDNPDYTSPPGVFRERDRSRPDEEIYRNEQALDLIITNLEEEQSREVIKYLFKPMDVFNYSEMKLFFHGDENNTPGSVSYNDGVNYDAEVYFRFGSDSNNYYEYRQPVQSDWNEVSIKFSELTAIKQTRGDSINIITRVPVPGRPGHYYQLKGNPSLTSIKFLTIGVKNIASAIYTGPISGEIWVNELRVIGADDTPGWAFSVSTNLKMADLITVNFNMGRTDPNFHKLSDRFGSRIESSNWAASADLDVLKALPVRMPESTLRINYSHTESVGKPVYIPGTDIKVEEAAKQTTTKPPEDIRAESQTVQISDTWTSSNIKLKIPTDYWLIRDSFNALTFGFNYNSAFNRSPTVLTNTSWLWNATANYLLNFSPDYYFYPQQIPVLGSVVSLFSDYKNVKVFYSPQNFALNISAKRNRNNNLNRPQANNPSQEIITRDFTTTRGFNFSWKITEGGFLNLSTAYTANFNSSLAYLETDQYNNQRPEKEIWKEIFSGAFFGKDNQFQQNLEFRTAPKLPTLWDINRFFSITTGYSAGYQWNFDFRQPDLGRSAGFTTKFNAGLVLRLKSLTDPLFAKDETETGQVPGNNQPGNTPGDRGRGGDRSGEGNQNIPPGVTKTDSTVQEGTESDTTVIVEGEKKAPLKTALLFLTTAVRVIFFEYETISFNFTNDNSVSKSGILAAGTGFKNFWGFSYDDKDGPSRGYMLGLNSSVGPRAYNANLQDVYSQKNNLDFKTSRPLWEGAKIDINWKVGWSLNKSTSLNSDSLGMISVLNQSSTGTINRSFFSLPLAIFQNGIEKVAELYDPASPDPAKDLSDAFTEGFETLPWLSNLGFLNEFAKYIPRANWRLTWDGLEKFFLFQKIATKVSLDHAYNAGYTEGWKINPEGSQEIQSQKIEYAFAPLAGLNFTFGELWGGNLNSNLKYSTRTNYDLGITTKNITETFSREIGLTAGFSKSGFEIPFFGLSLQNDIEFSFSYTRADNSTVLYNMNQFSSEGTPQDGSIRITIEPRIKYTISSKVTLSIFYKRSGVEPKGASRIPPTTTNEAGLDVRISIQ